MWGSRKQNTKAGSLPGWYIQDAGAGGKVPKGYIPMVLVHDGQQGEQGQRILVHIKMLREPCMEALLEMAEHQFGYGQDGVLKIPCDVACFEHMIHGLKFGAAT